MENLLTEPQIGQGWVLHARPKNKKLAFRYPIFNFFLPLAPGAAETTPRLPATFTVHAKNYLAGEATDLVSGVYNFLREKVNYVPERVVLQTLPSMLGYVFNPVSFWYCFKNGAIDAVLCEVNNTFGDRHFYFLKDLPTNGSELLQSKKVFHVSPFFDVSGSYRFFFRFQGQESDVSIRYYGDNGELRLDTRIVLQLQPLASVSSAGLWGRYGWMTALVILRIHWQAMRLWFHRAKFHRRPLPPERNVTT